MKKVFMLSSIGGLLSQNVATCLRDSFPDSILLGTDIHLEHSGTHFVNEFVLTERAESKTFLMELALTIDTYRPDFYFPLNEVELMRLAELRTEKREEIFKDTKLVWSGENVLAKFLHKDQTMSFLDSINVMRPKTYSPSSSNEFNFPIVVKPNNGSGSKNLFLCENLAQYEAAMVFVTNPIIQEYIPSSETEYTVGVFARRGEIARCIAFRRKLSPGGGTSWCETYFDRELEKISKKVAKAIDLHGSINIQLRKHNDQYYIFEVNPRFSSTVHIRSKLGFQDVLWSIEDSADFSLFDSKDVKASRFAVIQSEVELGI
jgi:carbamoyl-phosphate synthase large subunit